MLVAAIDTTVRTGSYALVRDDDVLAVCEGDAARAHAERLPGALIDLAAQVGVPLGDVDAFAVAAGPGSFTGLRIGIAAIQGLAFAYQRPALGVSALDALAEAVVSSGGLTTPYLGVWMDAQRDEVFAALYRGQLLAGGTPEVETVDPALVAPPEEVLRRWRALGVGRVLFAGSGALVFRPAIESDGGAASDILPATPLLAPAVARLAVRRLAAGQRPLPHAIVPIYVRRPDAELARDRRAGGADGGRRD